MFYDERETANDEEHVFLRTSERTLRMFETNKSFNQYVNLNEMHVRLVRSLFLWLRNKLRREK